MLRSNKQGRFPVAYHENNLSKMVDMQGRLTQGLSDEAEFPDERSTKAFEKISDCMPIYHASRGLFAAPRIYKELMRGGDAGPCLDFDISKSFARSMLHRHPHLKPLFLWVNSPEEMASESGITVELAKEFCNGCVGSGKKFVTEWLESASLQVLPQHLVDYKKATEEVMRIDVEEHPDLLERIMEKGYL